MDEQLPQPRPKFSWLNRDGPWLVALLLFVGLLRGWLIVNTEVTARDSIGFIRYSLLFDHKSWSEALCSQHQHPGYPVLVWLTATPIRAIYGTTPESMRVAAQSVNVVVSLLLAVMMFRLGKLLWDRYVGFFAALMFQFLPITGHHLSDGISDGLFLLLVVSALGALIRARAEGSGWRYALGGALIGLAYLTRPEGLLVLPAAWLFLVGLQFVRSGKSTWRHVAAGLAIVTGSSVAAGSPYYLATGKITEKPTALQILEESRAGPTENGGWPLFASVFASTFAPSPSTQVQLQRTLRTLFLELFQALNYAGGFFLIWAVLFCRKTLFRNPGFYLLAIYFAIHAAILVKLGLTVSYVSDRHVMALVAIASYPCVIGLAHLCSLSGRFWGEANANSEGDFLYPPAVQTVAALGLMVSLAICAGKTVTRLHGNRVGNHQAGIWLAGQVKPGDMVEDDHNWSHYYAGQVFVEGKEPVLPSSVVPNRFVVMTRSKDADVREQREQREQSLKQAGGRLVYHWPTDAEGKAVRIVVYSLPRDFQTNPWKKDAAPSVVGQTVNREK